jgi:hypothetical protein
VAKALVPEHAEGRPAQAVDVHGAAVGHSELREVGERLRGRRRERRGREEEGEGHHRGGQGSDDEAIRGARQSGQMVGSGRDIEGVRKREPTTKARGLEAEECVNEVAEGERCGGKRMELRRRPPSWSYHAVAAGGRSKPFGDGTVCTTDNTGGWWQRDTCERRRCTGLSLLSKDEAASNAGSGTEAVSLEHARNRTPAGVCGGWLPASKRRTLVLRAAKVPEEYRSVASLVVASHGACCPHGQRQRV